MWEIDEDAITSCMVANCSVEEAQKKLRASSMFNTKQYKFKIDEFVLLQDQGDELAQVKQIYTVAMPEAKTVYPSQTFRNANNRCVLEESIVQGVSSPKFSKKQYVSQKDKDKDAILQVARLTFDVLIREFNYHGGAGSALLAEADLQAIPRSLLPADFGGSPMHSCPNTDCTMSETGWKQLGNREATIIILFRPKSRRFHPTIRRTS